MHYVQQAVYYCIQRYRAFSKRCISSVCYSLLAALDRATDNTAVLFMLHVYTHTIVACTQTHTYRCLYVLESAMMEPFKPAHGLCRLDVTVPANATVFAALF
eukprot:15559-Heterococcus_DN1.PRE.1